MPEVHEPGKAPDENGTRRFINEKVVKQPLTRRQLAKRTLALFLVAIVFGSLAAISFALTRPLVERYLCKETVEESSVCIPKDEVPVPTQAEETPAESTTQESEPIEDKVQSALENYHYTVDDLSSMISSLRAQVQKATKGIVVVHSVQQQVDWFDNSVETTGLYAGAVIAETEQELLILTPEAAVEAADSIRVTFGDGSDVSGRMKQKDTISGMAIVSVNVTDLNESIRQSVQVVPLGNSYTVREGDLIVAAGGPAGVVHSLDYGIVSYIMKNTPMVDQWSRVLYSDILADTETGTFFLNASGELIGWAEKTREESNAAQTRVAKIIGISDYKGILERLSNGLGAPSFGIIGQEVSDAMAEQGLVKGIYVVSTLTDGPAYSAGIQNGDIIVEANGKEIASMKDFQAMMEDLECGQLINVTVERNGRDQFARLDFQVTIGAR